MQIQTIIHKLEEGGGLRYLKFWLLGLLLLGLVLGYNIRGFKNMSNVEAMDAAQLARNIAEGKGYHTLFVRPLSIYLLEKTYADNHGPPRLGDLTDRAQLHSPHPDLANPPVYPFALASLMKVIPPIRYQSVVASKVGNKHLDAWNYDGNFWIYPPDFWISFFNQFLFIVMAVMLFFLARRLLDATVAWISTLLFLGTDLFWRFSISGLSTMLVMLIFLGLAWCIVLLEEKGRDAQAKPGRLQLLAVACGVLVGIGCLTRYSFGWLILPTLVFIVLFVGRQRVILSLIALAAFCLVVSPWVARNYHVSHTFFGTAGYAAYEGTSYFPEYRLERSLNPDLTRVRYTHVFFKFLANTRDMLQDDLPRLGGSWISALFLVGLLINFRNPTLNRLRYFLLLCLPVLIVAEAVGRTQISVDSPVINTENLLVLLAPPVIMFGVAFFYILLDQLDLPIVQLRYLVVGSFCFIICLPTVLNLISPRIKAISYPPYYPPYIQMTANWMKPDELMMSDIPWAVAWYGDRQCLWLTLNAQRDGDFFAVYDYKKTISAIYLTPVTMESKFQSQWVRNSEITWGKFAIEIVLNGGALPRYFPLKNAPTGFLPEQLFLTDSDRWAQPSQAASTVSTGAR